MKSIHECVLFEGVDEFLVRKSMRKCEVIGNIEFGEKLPNATYTHTLGLLQSMKADLFLRAGPDYHHEDWLQKSWPIQVDRVLRDALALN